MPAFRAERTEDVRLLAETAGLSEGGVLDRLRKGHSAYLAHLGEAAVGYGWSATREAAIGERGLAFRLPAGNRYLWDFATLPTSRGQGVYPRLLQAILKEEQREAERFWIGHDLENAPSARGILKAGFQPVGRVAPAENGNLVLVQAGPRERAAAGAALLGIPLSG